MAAKYIVLFALVGICAAQVPQNVNRGINPKAWKPTDMKVEEEEHQTFRPQVLPRPHVLPKLDHLNFENLPSRPQLPNRPMLGRYWGEGSHERRNENQRQGPQHGNKKLELSEEQIKQMKDLEKLIGDGKHFDLKKLQDKIEGLRKEQKQNHGSRGQKHEDNRKDNHVHHGRKHEEGRKSVDQKETQEHRGHDHAKNLIRPQVQPAIIRPAVMKSSEEKHAARKVNQDNHGRKHEEDNKRVARKDKHDHHNRGENKKQPQVQQAMKPAVMPPQGRRVGAAVMPPQPFVFSRPPAPMLHHNGNHVRPMPIPATLPAMIPEEQKPEKVEKETVQKTVNQDGEVVKFEELHTVLLPNENIEITEYKVVSTQENESESSDVTESRTTEKKVESITWSVPEEEPMFTILPVAEPVHEE